MVLVSLMFIVAACSATPTTRYDINKKKQYRQNNEKLDMADKNKIELIEDYNVKRFTPDLTGESIQSGEDLKTEKNIWYQFPGNPESETNFSENKNIETVDGYRVLVLITDILEEVNSIKIKLEEVKGRNNIYSIFEPPFFKILLGDFISLEDANSLKNKLLQLGFKESKVVRTKIHWNSK